MISTDPRAAVRPLGNSERPNVGGWTSAAALSTPRRYRGDGPIG